MWSERRGRLHAGYHYVARDGSSMCSKRTPLFINATETSGSARHFSALLCVILKKFMRPEIRETSIIIRIDDYDSLETKR